MGLYNILTCQMDCFTKPSGKHFEVFDKSVQFKKIITWLTETSVFYVSRLNFNQSNQWSINSWLSSYLKLAYSWQFRFSKLIFILTQSSLRLTKILNLANITAQSGVKHYYFTFVVAADVVNLSMSFNHKSNE